MCNFNTFLLLSQWQEGRQAAINEAIWVAPIYTGTTKLCGYRLESTATVSFSTKTTVYNQVTLTLFYSPFPFVGLQAHVCICLHNDSFFKGVKKQAAMCLYESERMCKPEFTSHVETTEWEDVWCVACCMWCFFAFCDALNTATENKCYSFHHNCIVQIELIFLCSDQF